MGYPVRGALDGIKGSNRNINRVEPLITPDQLRKTFLFGINIRNRETGEELTDEAIQEFINMAVSLLEHDLDISIIQQTVEEYKDFSHNAYFDWGYLMSNNVPIIQIDSLEFIYMRDETNTDNIVLQIPASWLRIDSHSGVIRMIPNARFPGNLQIGRSGLFFPEVLRAPMVPHLWKLTYTFGFEDGKIPVLVNKVVGMIAAMMVFFVGGSLVLGAGIASSSIGLDGLSESISTTQSAENSAYSAQIKELQTYVFGRNEAERAVCMIKILRDYYRGASLAVL